MVRSHARGAIFVLASLTVGCGVRAPQPLDVAALVRAKGAVEARRDLEVHVIDEPRDVQARLALARLADEARRPGQAIEQLEAVLRLGGPIGTRWHAEDRARLWRLLAARGRVRFAREAPTALADLARARGYGAAITDAELDAARAVIALAQLRHVDAKERAKGQSTLAALADRAFADASWIGAKPRPVPRDRGAFGAWLWAHGARRAAWEMLRDYAATTAVKGGPLHDAYLRAYRWWIPHDGRAPAVADLLGPERCRFVGVAGCEPAALLAGEDLAAQRALAAAAITPTAEPLAASAWIELTLPQALRGEVAWGAAIAAHVDLDTLDRTQLAPAARAALARLSGRSEPGVGDGALAELRSSERLVVAAQRALDGASEAQLRGVLGPLADTPEGLALVAIASPAAPAVGDPLVTAVERFARARGATTVPIAMLVAGYRKDPAIAERYAREAVAEATDAAAAHATLGAVWSVLEDPARAPAAWEAAVASSPEPAYVRGLAEAIARAGDPDAAMIQATTAAAAAGDPAEVWLEVARALVDVDKPHAALEAARSAIDLASDETLAAALDVAIEASHAAGRDEQTIALAGQRSDLPPPTAAPRDTDPTDARAAVAAHIRAPTGSTLARLWVASRWNPRHVPVRAALLAAIDTSDPRRAVLVSELVALAGDRELPIARAAIRALRR